jgi:uncharacterized protein YeaO (DUF488 family)
MDILTKRVYEPAGSSDGLRVLVDRVWPRGLTKTQVNAALWVKELAPSPALRKWFDHDRVKWEAFRSRYFLELDDKPGAVAELLGEAAQRPLTLLFSARDTECNQAVALRDYLLLKSRKGAGGSRSDQQAPVPTSRLHNARARNHPR